MIGRIGITIRNTYMTIWLIVLSPGEWFYKSDFVFRSFPLDNITVILHTTRRSADYCAREEDTTKP